MVFELFSGQVKNNKLNSGVALANQTEESEVRGLFRGRSPELVPEPPL